MDGDAGDGHGTGAANGVVDHETVGHRVLPADARWARRTAAAPDTSELRKSHRFWTVRMQTPADDWAPQYGQAVSATRVRMC